MNIRSYREKITDLFWDFSGILLAFAIALSVGQCTNYTAGLAFSGIRKAQGPRPPGRQFPEIKPKPEPKPGRIFFIKGERAA